VYRVKQRTDIVIAERVKIGWALQGSRMLVTVWWFAVRASTEFDVVGDE